MESLAEFIRKHPWWQWLTRTPLSAKMTKYALSSVIAFLLSVIAFPLVYAIDGGQTTVASVVAFFAAAIPNWLMNRRWAWQQTGRAPKKQMISYAAVSAMVLLVTAFWTGRTNHWVKHSAHIENHHGLRLLVIEGSFVLITVILFFAKFAIYEYVIFAEERGHRRWWHLGGSAEAPSAAMANEPPMEDDPQVESSRSQEEVESAAGPTDEFEAVLSSSPTE
jgi:putative flippase GtrA